MTCAGKHATGGAGMAAEPRTHPCLAAAATVSLPRRPRHVLSFDPSLSAVPRRVLSAPSVCYSLPPRYPAPTAAMLKIWSMVPSTVHRPPPAARLSVANSPVPCRKSSSKMLQTRPRACRKSGRLRLPSYEPRKVRPRAWAPAALCEQRPTDRASN